MKALRDRADKLAADARAIIAAADSEGRGLRSEELEKFEALTKEHEELTRAIAAAERLESRTKAGAAAEGEARIVKPTGTDEYRSGFLSYMRGEMRAAQTLAPDSAGGFLVPDALANTLITALNEQNVIRSMARKFSTMAGTFTIPTVSAHGAASWVAEEGPNVEAPETFGSVTLSPYKMVSALAVSEELLQDSQFDLEAYIASEFGRRLAALEEAAFVAGDGSSKPTGFLAASGGAGTGVTTASATAITWDEVLTLYGSLEAAYRNNAVFIMAPATLIYLLKIKTGVASDLRYIWTTNIAGEPPATILGRPVILSSNMGAISSAQKSILFADPSYYAIAERPSVSLMRDPYSQGANGRVVFRAFRRVDGKLTLAAAAKVCLQKT